MDLAIRSVLEGTWRQNGRCRSFRTERELDDELDAETRRVEGTVMRVAFQSVARSLREGTLHPYSGDVDLEALCFRSLAQIREIQIAQEAELVEADTLRDPMQYKFKRTLPPPYKHLEDERYPIEIGPRILDDVDEDLRQITERIWEGEAFQYAVCGAPILQTWRHEGKGIPDGPHHPNLPLYILTTAFETEIEYGMHGFEIQNPIFPNFR